MPLKRRQRELLDRVIEALDAAGAKPPRPRDLAHELRVPAQAVEAIFALGIEEGEIVRLSNGFHFAAKSFAKLAHEGYVRFGESSFEVKDWRDYLDISRETAYALLEQMEAMGLASADGGKRRFSLNE